VYTYKRLSQVYESAKRLPIDETSRIVLMSDCHRSDGSNSDDFAKNQNSYFVALNYYNNHKFVYIELGDGDELWETRTLKVIEKQYKNIYWLISKFYADGRFYTIYGNHDMVKKNPKFVKKNLTQYYDEHEKKMVPFLPGIEISEGIVLEYHDMEILLAHGHQGDLYNDRLWKVNRFLVRYLWRPLELMGIEDPTSASKNYKPKLTNQMTEWASKEKKILIAGHTHRPAFPEPGTSLYFNDGCCVHPRCITAIEIEYGTICLVKWSVEADASGVLRVVREELAGPELIDKYFMT
jgi:UDP-2,3-diacylglucosamine pyrophosphatase LpxH